MSIAPIATIEFPGLAARDANIAAQELAQSIMRSGASEDIVQFKKIKPDSQDVGTILSIILGSAAITALAEGLRIFIAKRGTRLSIKLPDGTNVEVGGNPTYMHDIPELVKRLKLHV